MLVVAEVPARVYRRAGLCLPRLFTSDPNRISVVLLRLHIFIPIGVLVSHLQPWLLQGFTKIHFCCRAEVESTEAKYVFSFLDHIKPVAKLTILFWLIVLIQEALAVPLVTTAIYFML